MTRQSGSRAFKLRSILTVMVGGFSTIAIAWASAGRHAPRPVAERYALADALICPNCNGRIYSLIFLEVYTNCGYPNQTCFRQNSAQPCFGGQHIKMLGWSSVSSFFTIHGFGVCPAS